MRTWRTWFEKADCTKWVLVANVAIFAAGVALARTPCSLAGLPAPVLYALGMSDALAVFRETRAETLVTSCFVHASIVHLLGNLYILVEVGPPVERALGRTRMAILYLACGAFGSLASASVGWIAEAPRTSEGLSGALLGVLCAALVQGLRAEGWGGMLARSMARWLGLLVVLQVAATALGLASHLDQAAHLGAAALGALLGATWAPRTPPSPRGASWAPGAGAALVAACFALCVYRGQRDPFSTLGATDRCDLASILIRSGQCEAGRSALDSAARLSPAQPTVLALESEWQRTCAGRPSPRS